MPDSHIDILVNLLTGGAQAELQKLRTSIEAVGVQSQVLTEKSGQILKQQGEWAGGRNIDRQRLAILQEEIDLVERLRVAEENLARAQLVNSQRGGRVSTQQTIDYSFKSSLGGKSAEQSAAVFSQTFAKIDADQAASQARQTQVAERESEKRQRLADKEAEAVAKANRQGVIQVEREQAAQRAARERAGDAIIAQATRVDEAQRKSAASQQATVERQYNAEATAAKKGYQEADREIKKEEDQRKKRQRELEAEGNAALRAAAAREAAVRASVKLDEQLSHRGAFTATSISVATPGELDSIYYRLRRFRAEQEASSASQSGWLGRLFGGINRQGALEAQAAVVNTVQAMASGMSPGHVALMEGTQLAGAAVQGGLIDLKTIFDAIKSPIGIVTLALTAFAATLYEIGMAASRADQAIGEARNRAVLQGTQGPAIERDINRTQEEVRQGGALGRQDARLIATTVQGIPNISQEARDSLGRQAESISRLRFGGDIEKTAKFISETFGDTSKLKVFVEETNLLKGSVRETFDAAVAIGDGFTASKLAAQGLEDRVKPTMELLKNTRQDMGTFLRNMDIFGIDFENRLRRATGTAPSWTPLTTPRFPGGTQAPDPSIILAQRAADQTLKTEATINALLLQRQQLVKGVAAADDPETRVRIRTAQEQNERMLRHAFTPREQEEIGLQRATIQAQATQAEQAATHDANQYSKITDAARAHYAEVTAHAQSEAATRAGITAKTTAEMIAAEQQVRDAILKTQQIQLAQALHLGDVQRAGRPQDIQFQRQVAESQFQTLVASPGSTQAQKDQKVIEIVGLRRQERLEVENLNIAEIQNLDILSEAVGRLQEILAHHRQINSIIQNSPDRSQLEKQNAANALRQKEVQIEQRQLARDILNIEVQRAMVPTDVSAQRLLLEKEYLTLQASGLATEEQLQQKIVEVINARRQERLEVENVNIALMRQREVIAQSWQDLAQIVRLRQREADLITASRDRTPQEKLAAQTQLIQAMVAARQKSVEYELQTTDALNRADQARASVQSALIQNQVSSLKITQEAGAQAELQLSNRVFAEQERRIQNQLKNENLTLEQRANLNEKLANLYEQDAQKQIELTTKVTEAIRAENERRTQYMRSFFESVGSAAQDLLIAGLTKSQTRTEALRSFANSIMSSFVREAGNMASSFAGKGLAKLLGVDVPEGQTGIGNVLATAIGQWTGLTSPVAKVDQAAAAQKMGSAADAHKAAADALLGAAREMANAAKGIDAAIKKSEGIAKEVETKSTQTPGAVTARPRSETGNVGAPGTTVGENDNVVVTTSDRVERALDIIESKESGGANIKQKVIGPKGGYNPSVGRVTGPSSAQGYFQITDQTWGNFAPNVGIDTSVIKHAMDATYDQQRAVARNILQTSGIQHWALPGNTALRTALKNEGFPWSGPVTTEGSATQVVQAVTQSGDKVATAVQNQSDAAKTATAPVASGDYTAVGDSIAAHLIRKGGLTGSEDRTKVGSWREGDTAVSGWGPGQVSWLINQIPDEKIKGQNVVLSSGVSNKPEEIGLVGTQIQQLYDKGAASVTLLGVGNAEKLNGINDKLATIASDSHAAFTGPLKSVMSDGIHSADNADLVKQIRAAQLPVGTATTQPPVESTGTSAPPTPAPAPAAPQRTLGDLLAEAQPRYGEITGGKNLSEDLTTAWGHPYANMSTALRIKGTFEDPTLGPIWKQAGETVQGAYPGLNLEKAFMEGKPGLSDLMKLPLKDDKPVKVDPASVAQGVTEGQGQVAGQTQQAVGQGVAQGQQQAASTTQQAVTQGVVQGQQQATQATQSNTTDTQTNTQAVQTSSTAIQDNTQAVKENTQAQQQKGQGSGAGGGTSTGQDPVYATSGGQRTGGGGSSTGSGSFTSGFNMFSQGIGIAASAAALFGNRLSTTGRIVLGTVGLIGQLIPFVSNLSSAFGAVSTATQGAASATSVLQGANTMNTAATVSNTAATQMNSTAQTAGGGGLFGGIGSIFKMIPFIGGMFEQGGVVPSAEGGMVMDGRGGKLSILHPKEMVLPARLSDGLQDIITSGQNYGSANNSVNTNNSLTYSPTYHGYHPYKSRESVRDLMRTHGNEMMKWVEAEMHNGRYRPALG